MSQPITEQGRRDQLLNAAKGCGKAIEAKMAPINSIAAALGIGLSMVMELHAIANALERQNELAYKGKGL
ncbi:MAG: hypothetical protein DRH08_00635 [Deltaproteobacteria bacterium]|nr:MAG: hypothetical protein DRH08_00635 [Deltaproteobacteria bacterium]